jgi:3'(2'), 5'-bisphosphate nucleotidase
LGGRFLVVDPLDGTREFLAGLDEFTVNIALIENETPVAGVLAAPARGLIWRGHVGHGAERLALSPGKAFQPIRIAVTGSKISPGLFESLELLGKEESLRRLSAAAGSAAA